MRTRSVARRERSPAAQEASRRNGSLSRGPRSAKGKRRSARNAVKHGLRGCSILTRDAMPNWLAEIEDALLDLLGSANHFQREQLDRLLLAYWQLWRADELIDVTTRRMFGTASGQSADPGSVDDEGIPPFLIGDPEGDLRQLAQLHAYRRRFRGQRDRCLARLFHKGLPPSATA